MSELIVRPDECYFVNESFEAAQAKGYRDMSAAGTYIADHERKCVTRAIRNGLYGAGIPVECSKGEGSAGQGEINIKYDEALVVANRHSITKNACEEIAWAMGRSLALLLFAMATS